MKPNILQPGLSRRRFLRTTAAIAVGGFLGGRPTRLHAALNAGETDHFWYRLASEGPYVDSQRDHKAFGVDDGKILLSEDNARTWAHTAAFSDARNITFSCILKNGNILFATREKLFLSTDN